jgi:hypothetical protein
MKSLIKILISLLLLILNKSDTTPRLQRGVNGSEFKTPGKLHILRVAIANLKTHSFPLSIKRRGNMGIFIQLSSFSQNLITESNVGKKSIR